ncbi:putative N-acetyltransferase [Vibrio sinaloensis DSM 21326]|uniref:Putative N-acetyltransferase n=1 Tax=Vibrio sinaloensis DSM 21326 TaxID=945550 RepID=E8MDI0_PHOS4|nr:N-acetyltransferase [Vibrio sinaloensis]EGA67966.1 putative N-acetyltransferase [Vibrio sinaloensis DSM 21326]
MLHYQETYASLVPLDLLLEADPDEANIESYLREAWCFAATQGTEIIGACIVTAHSSTLAEIVNIAVYPQHQQNGVGSKLLSVTLNKLSGKGIKRVELGTGTFGHQLAFYQRAGFRVDKVEKNYFIDNYPQPIFEEGIQHKDRLVLSLEF